jgi:transcriptional regulator with PAS, ATPase and Fis domain
MARPASPARLLLKFFEHADRPVYLLDHQRKLTFVNEACCRWLGRTAEELLGLRFDFQAVTTGKDATAVSELALGPPPEAYLSDTLAGEVRGGPPNQPQEIREALFLSLAEEAATPALSNGQSARSVFVVVQGAAAAPSRGSSERGAASRSVHHDLLQLRGELGALYFQAPLIGQSPAIRRLREQVKVAQQAQVRVLVVGPEGSGRKQLARAIHYASDAQQVGPLAMVDCPVMDAELIQLTITRFLQQREGQNFRKPPALLLMDVDRLRPDAQQELAGFLLLPGIELPTISTASRSLHKLAGRGKFRQDLAFALSTFTLLVPPLSRRREDIPLLAQHFVEQHNSRAARQHSGFTTEALELLSLFPWPGNVEELAAVVRECCETASEPAMGADELPSRLHHGREALLHKAANEPAIKLDPFLAEVEKELFQRALKRTGGNRTKAAELLGINRARLIRRLVQLGLAQPTTAEEESVIFEPLQPEDE